ncbi:MAG: hypothetical protein DI551_00980 [Micavibrio aeruginosavorus]|uniref:N-acetyltransferase domain-containing protein n=1 Tax=Micavibrio aeruginosavorus TaxID=349221 RepID=A0A2W5N823_9BACT|nr:MAG: hypothetical protein DI551_00980 [Micavibrio aeruginosavorus]
MEKSSYSSGEIIRLDMKHGSGQMRLLERIYDEVYLPAFPLEDEQTPLDVLKDRLEKGAKSPNEFSFFVAGADLDDVEAARLDAIGINIFYKNEQASLLAYNAVAPHAQGQGLGRSIFGAGIDACEDISRREGLKVRPAFLEVNNPEIVTEAEDVMPPQKRLETFKKWGAQEVPIGYVQPSLGVSAESCSRLKLLHFATRAGRHADMEDTLGFLNGISRACVGAEYKSSPDFIRMEAETLAVKFGAASRGAVIMPPSPRIASQNHILGMNRPA